MKIINNRYKIINLLESDIYGNVYHVADTHNENCALRLKLFSLEVSESEVVDYYKNHFINLVTVVHKHLLRAYEFEIVTSIDNILSVKKQYFYTAEYYDPSQCISLEVLSDNERIEVVKQICYGLDYLHFRGVVYRFLSPFNVFIFREEGQLVVKLNDVASIYNTVSHLGSKEEFVKQFFAPEVLRHDMVTVESDIYSLGIFVFFLFHRMNPKQVNFREVFNDSSDQEIDRLISVMTFNNHHERYQTIQEFVCAFQKNYIFEYPFWDHSYYEKLNFLNPMIGRKRLKERSLSLIENKIRNSKDVRMLMFEGEAGSGKTRFLDEIIFLNRINNIKITTAELGAKHSSGFYTIKKILRDIIRQHSVDPLLIKKYGSELVKVLPEMSEKWKLIHSPILTDERKEELRLMNRIFRFIIEFASHNPLIIFIDNFHYMSKQEFELIDHLMEFKKQLPLVILCTYREDLFQHPIEIQNWFDSGNAEKLTLNKFNYSEAAEMVAGILGVGQRPMELTTKIMTEAMGNPKYIEEVIKNLYMFEYLYVNDQRKWEMNVEYIKELELPLRVDDIVNHPVESLDEESLTALQAISVFEVPVSFEILGRMLNLDNVKLDLVLNKLVSTKLLNRKLGDWGYRYDFYNKRFRKLIFSGISEDVRLAYHQRASYILEQLYLRDSRMESEGLIYHLIHCGRLDDAAKYAVESAEKMEQLNIHKQAIEFYKKALELMRKLDHSEQIARLMVQFANILLRMNESDQAVATLNEALSIAERGNDQNALIDIWNLKAEISLLKRDLDGVAKHAEHTLDLAKDIEYMNGELDAALILCRVHLARGQFDEIKKISEVYLPITRKQKQMYYYGRFLNEIGIYYIQKNKTSDAFKSFLESYSYLEKASGDFDMTRPLNNLGLLSFDSLGDVAKSREYYSKAVEITEKMNITWGKDMLYSNLSETYIKEDRYGRALAYLSDAIRIAESSGTHDVLFYIYSNLCVVNYEMCRFDEAFRYLIKLEYEYRSRVGKALYEGFYHLNHIGYYIRIKDYKSAYMWYERIQRLDITLPENIEFGLKLNKIRLDIFTGNLQKQEQEMLFDNLEVLIKASTNPIEIKDVRDLILDIAYEYLQAHKFIEVQRLLDIDGQLIDVFNTDRLAVKRSVLSGVMDENPVAYFENLLDTIKDRPYSTEKWIAHFLLGNAYLDEKAYYQAVVQYVNALEIIKSITYLIPEEQRFNYINNDDSKRTLYQKLGHLMNQVLNRKGSQRVLTDINESLDLNAYFELSDLNKLAKNRKFLKSVRDHYRMNHGFDVESIDHFMEALGTREYSNIQIVIQYLIQLTFADHGAIYIYDEVTGVQETIFGLDESSPSDVSYYINMLEDQSEGIRLLNQSRHKSVDANEHESKAVILIPIVSHQEGKHQSVEMKRRYDSENMKAKTIGFLYLSSDKVYNNFTKDAFQKCRAFANLLYVMLDNYELKKMSSVDKLTGVLLRKHIEDLFTEELVRSKDQHHELSVVMADIDHFKNVNDMYGHQRGDEILRSIGHIFLTNLRDEDLVGRYGGEEFIIILPKTGEIDAFNVCEKVRSIIETSDLLGNDVPLTMSFGISSFPTHGIIEHELIEKADQALYESKHMGRNRSTIWTPYIGDSMLRFDKLAGILVGNISSDTRKVQSIVDIMTLINRPITREAKMYETLSQLIDICEADTATLLSLKDNQVIESFSREFGQEQMHKNQLISEHIIKQTLNSDFGEFFIDWSEPIYTEKSKIPDWLSYIVVPMVYKGERKGMIVLSVSVGRKEFDFDVFNYVNTLSGVISVIMNGDKG